MNKYTEAIQGDDVVILCDGIPMGVGEILAALNAATPPADAALSSVVIPAGCVCTTKANDMAALIESAICDAELERIIEESDARWTEDMFHVHGGELMDMLRKAAALRARQEVAVPEGFRMVPVEPTDAMFRAANKYELQCAIQNYGGCADAAGIWDAMLAASVRQDGAR